jgi:hypothetical protein
MANMALHDDLAAVIWGNINEPFVRRPSHLNGKAFVDLLPPTNVTIVSERKTWQNSRYGRN